MGIRMKTLSLKYGEYYSLKITDSNKNVINSVEITGSQITSEQEILSKPSYESMDGENKDRINRLMKGEDRLLELKEKQNKNSLCGFKETNIICAVI